MRLRTAWRVLVPILSCLSALIVVELLLAVFHPVPFSIERNMYFEADPYTGFRLRPNSRGRWGDIPAIVNANGHRDAPASVARRPGVRRILVLGDSFTVGADVRQEESYPEVLERLLNAQSAQPIEVINSGVGGWDPFSYAQYYEHYGRAFRPDLIVVGLFVGNDAYSQTAGVDGLLTAILGRRVTRTAAGYGALTSVLVFLTEHSNLARLLLQRSPPIEDFRRKNCSDFTQAYLDIERAALPNHLKRDARQLSLAQPAWNQMQRIKALADADGLPMVVALLPDENQINPALAGALIPAGEHDRYDFAMPQSMLTDIFTSAGIRTIDLLAAFQADSRCLYYNTTHWSAEGHALAATVIAEQIGAGPWSSSAR